MAAGLTRRSAGAATSVQKEGSSLEAAAMLQKQQQQQSSGKENENGSSNGNGNQHSNINGTSETMSTTAPTAANSQGKSIAERSQIPYSFAITYGTVLGLEWFGGLWRPETATHWWDSLAQSTRALWDLLVYTQSVLVRLVVGSTQTIDGSTAANALEWREIITTLTVLAVCLSLSYVFFVAPFRAGLWTGRKAKRHVFHRYMGLCYLIHYVLAWVEFFATSSSSATDAAPPRHSYLCHIIAVMGKQVKQTKREERA